MRKNSKYIALAGSILSFFSFPTSTLAAVPIPAGWYLDINAGKVSSNAPAITKENNTWAYDINAGYKFIPFFGLEIGYINYKKLNAQSYDVLAKGIIPFQDTGASVFAKAGAARMKEQGSGDSTDLMYGLGADYSFSPNAAVMLQWLRTNDKGGKLNNLDLWTIGISFSFS